MRIALFEPDIPQNTGAIVRVCACFGVPLDIIEPCGFTFVARELRRAALDYAPLAAVDRHESFAAFQAARGRSRLVLITTKARQHYSDFSFRCDDVLLFGREQAGVPQTVHAVADVRLRVPMRAAARSLNVAVTVGLVLAEALRQQGWPGGLV
ncbi:MAG: tRNA (cytidine(34)-2'-O)-methyltransferase [Alphaproteobacteria bacterium]|nr:tRNA (cytidine(34)-2'-O)-methyltransferase [Alphaproteobacteria bacterium]